MSSMILLFSILSVAAGTEVEVCELGEGCEGEWSSLLQAAVPSSALTSTESGASSSPTLLCDPTFPFCTCNYPSGLPRLYQPRTSTTFLDDCNAKCAAASKPAFGTEIPGAAGADLFCFCCDSLSKRNTGPTDSGGIQQMYQVVAAAVDGDPHIKTLDGRRYTLMTQGTFSLWHYSGVEAELRRKKVPVDWEVYSQYSGHQSFTKGLLLVDKTGGSSRQVLEITAEDCQWRARKGNEEWTAVQNEEVLAVPDGNDYVSGFIVTKKDGPKGHNHVRLNMQTKDGKTDVAVLSLSCRPGHHLNLQMVMKRRNDAKFIDGQLKPSRNVSRSLLQTDSDFSMVASWQDLGGSAEAAAYFKRADDDQMPQLSLLATCSKADEFEAKQTCSKHLGHLQEGHDEHADETAFLNDCIFDLCHGAGETAAELAAELLASTRAIGMQ